MFRWFDTGAVMSRSSVVFGRIIMVHTADLVILM